MQKYYIHSVLPKLFMAPVRMPILRRFTHNSYMITKNFTSPKHDLSWFTDAKMRHSASMS